MKFQFRISPVAFKKLLDIHQVCWLLVLVSLLSVVSSTYSQTSTEKALSKVSFSRDIAPILASRCQGCHHDNKASMGFNVTSYEKIRRGGKQSSADEIIVAGKPEESRLVEVIQASAEPRMPLKLKPLAEKEITLISEWIRQGAVDDGPTPQTALITLAPPENLIKQFSGRSSNISTSPAIALSSDTRQIAITENNFIYIYNLNLTGLPAKKLGPIDGKMSTILFSKDGESIIVAISRPGIEGVVDRWELKSAQRKLHLKVHND
ncbi:MAG: c-type cytochrome domain-containing protein [bacterium]